MATMHTAGPGWKLEVLRDFIDVTSEHETPNERWRFTDSNGHGHYYDHGYPTLDLVIDREHWCDGTEGIYNHDPHMAVDESHYECKVCRERIEPLMDPPYTPKSIPGMTTATLKGVRSGDSGATTTISMALTEDEYASIYDAGDNRDAVAQALLDNAPDSRILTWESTLSPR